MRRKRRIGKVLRLVLSAIIVLGILGGVIGFSFGPSLVVKRLNSVNELISKPLSPAAQTLHQSLTIADLHADSLLLYEAEIQAAPTPEIADRLRSDLSRFLAASEQK